MSANADTVRAFIAACTGRDLPSLGGYLAADCFYHNIPTAPIEGREAAIAFLGAFADLSDEWRWEIHHLSEGADGTVLTERTDRFRVKDGRWLGVRVMGAFDLKDGLISAWRDYYDPAEAGALFAAAQGG